MADATDTVSRLQRMASEAQDAEDRAWALKKLAAMGAGEVRPVQAGPYSKEHGGYQLPMSTRIAPVGPSTDRSISETKRIGDERRLDQQRDWARHGVPGVAQEMLGDPEDIRQARNNGAVAVASLASGGLVGGVLAPVVAAGSRAAPFLSPLLRLGAGVAEGTASGLAEGGTSAGLDGRNVAEGASEGAKSGAGLGGLAAGAGELLRGGSRLLRGVDPWVRRAGEAADRGYYTSADAIAVPKGNEGMQVASERALQRVLNRDGELEQGARQAYRDRVDPELGRPVDPDTINRPLHDARVANLNPDTGAPLHPRVEDRLAAAMEETGKGAPSVGGTLARRRALKRDAQFQNPSPTPEQEAARDTYQALRSGVREASPAVREADDAFAAHARTRDRRSDILFNTEEQVIARNGEMPEVTPPVEYADEVFEAGARPRVGKERSAVTTLGRVGDDNVPGLRAKRYIEELQLQDPKIAEAIEELADIKARELTRLSLKGLGATDLQGAVQGAGLFRTVGQNARGIGAGLDTTLTLAGQSADEIARGAPVYLRGIDQAIGEGAEKRRKRKQDKSKK